ncbi:MAG: HAMP domain-containing histidine kinase [Alphaproteobacteria bacterium]|nr:HAMP domain-containing histidine kinase [Alphaproteobacteria bacterium]
MIRSTLEVKEGLRGDLVRVCCTACLPFMLYYLYLDMQYRSYLESLALTKPLSYVEYMMSRTSDFGVITFVVVVICSFLLFGSILGRKRLNFMFGKQIKQLNGKLSRVEADTSFQRLFIQRFKQMGKIISETMEYVEQSASNIPLEARKSIIQAVAELAEELSKGLCANLEKETLSIKEMLEQTTHHFTDYIQNHNIKLQMTCPEELTVVADPLFTRLIFLNILGLPLCSTQPNGEIAILVSQKAGYAHIEIHDTRYILTGAAKQHLKFPREFLAESDTLRQLCFQNGWSYEFKEHKRGHYLTKVSIPLKDYQAVEDNVVSLDTAIH